MLGAIKSIAGGIKGGLAQANFMKGNYQKALTQINSAIALERDSDSNPVYMAMKGKCLYHLGEKDKAKSFLESAEILLVPLLEQENNSYVINELARVKGYIEKCG